MQTATIDWLHDDDAPGSRVFERSLRRAPLELVEPVRAEGTLCDRSPTGLGLKVPAELAIGTRCALRVEAEAVHVEVVWVKREADGFRIGARLVER